MNEQQTKGPYTDKERAEDIDFCDPNVQKLMEKFVRYTYANYRHYDNLIRDYENRIACLETRCKALDQALAGKKKSRLIANVRGRVAAFWRRVWFLVAKKNRSIIFRTDQFLTNRIERN